ncbi:hypothetical protein ACAG26_21025 [Mycobacterium sp. pUA109]|uniref:hypothetical protein n=1 Tax=Mycobacterium sp. pUA109 TaxID=3238982 RepID=UPI00351B4D4F
MSAAINPFPRDSDRLRVPPAAPGTRPPAGAAMTQPIGIGQPSERRTRRTVDISRETHRALDSWQLDAASRLGVTRVTGQEVLSALVDQLLSDPELSAQIMLALRTARR